MICFSFGKIFFACVVRVNDDHSFTAKAFHVFVIISSLHCKSIETCLLIVKSKRRPVNDNLSFKDDERFDENVNSEASLLFYFETNFA